MKTNQADFPVRVVCRVLGLSPSGYYAWLAREPSARAQRDWELTQKIVTIWRQNRQVYGRPRIYADLKEDGEKVGQKRVGRLMKQAGIVGASRRRRGPKTTRRNDDARPVPDLVERDFTADGPDQLWVADITYIPTWAGFLYLAVVLDAWSRRVVGWSMATHTIMRCARASSRRWSASFSIRPDTERRPRPRWPSSTSSRASTTRAEDTPPSARSRRSTSSDAARPPREPAFYSPAARGKLSSPLGVGQYQNLSVYPSTKSGQLQ